MQQRRRFKQTTSFQQRLTEHAQSLKEEAEKVPRGAARDLLLRAARQAETAANMDAWLSSPGLRPPQ